MVGERYGPEFGCVKWKFETDGPVTAAVTVGREIKKTTKAYIACEDGKLYALDADTGVAVWSYDTNTPLFGSAAEGRDGTVYVGSEGGKLYAIDKKGQLLWTHTTGGPIYSTPAVTPNGRIYVCSVDGLIYALARDGGDLWSFETNGFAALGGSVFVSPQEAGDGSVYIAGLYDPNLYALDREDGSVKWACNFEFIIDPCDPNSGTRAGWPFAAPAVGADGTVYQTLLYDSNLYAIDAGTGGIIWSVDLADPCDGWFEPNDLATLRYSDGWSSPVVGPDGTIYVSLDDPYLRAVNQDGGIDWVTKLGEMGGFTLTVGSDGLIYAASDDNNLYVVNAEGAEIAKFESDDWLSHPVIGPDGTLYVSDANNAVWAISEEACDGETPVLNGSDAAKPKKPVKFRGRQVRKSKAGLRMRKGNRK
jgi:outer membrane protein assembly factor BamB